MTNISISLLERKDLKDDIYLAPIVIFIYASSPKNDRANRSPYIYILLAEKNAKKRDAAYLLNGR